MTHLKLFLIVSLLLLMGCGGSVARFPVGVRSPAVTTKPVKPEIILQQRYYGANDSVYLLLRFEDVRQVLKVQQKARAAYYTVRAGTAERDVPLLADSVSITTTGLKSTAELVLRLALPRQLVQAPHILQIQLWLGMGDVTDAVSMRYKLPLQASMADKKFLLLQSTSQLPIFQDYTTTSTALTVQSFADSLPTLMLQRFEADFTPALPPMSVKQEAIPRTITVQESINVVAGDSFKLSVPGLYLLAPGTSFSRGVLVQPNTFPQVTMAKELLPPLIYLTTSAEREAMEREADTKAAIDRFWLKITGDQNAARQLIRTYYGRVEQANKLYTSHKAGWATDRGMIFIIYGPPSDISRSGLNETWIYRKSQTSPYVKFVFTKKENNFTTNHYELIRRPDYEESWYSTVAKWRAGITGI